MKKTLKIVGVAIAVLVVLVVAAALFGGGGSRQSVTGGDGARPTGATPQVATFTASETSTPAPVLDNDKWPAVLSNPDSYKGTKVEITGKVFNLVPSQGNTVVFQVWTDPEKSEGNTLVVSSDQSLKGTLAKGTYVRIKGTILGGETYINVMGGTVTAPKVEASSVNLITRSEAIPAVKTVTVGSSVSQHGLTITLVKAELARTETRVYVKVANNSSIKASIFDFSALLVQGSKQLKPKTLLVEDYPRLDSTVLSGIEDEGTLIFDPVDISQGSAKLVWVSSGARLDDFRLAFKDWVFEFSWQ
jgi:hypothetical protein